MRNLLHKCKVLYLSFSPGYIIHRRYLSLKINSNQQLGLMSSEIISTFPFPPIFPFSSIPAWSCKGLRKAWIITYLFVFLLGSISWWPESPGIIINNISKDNFSGGYINTKFNLETAYQQRVFQHYTTKDNSQL